jgi:serine/threonine protein phosphatase PrpC
LSTRVPDPKNFATDALSDVGQVRTVNQDYCDEFFDAETGRRMLVLADGMGGHRGGEVASQMAVEAIGRMFLAGGPHAGELVRDALEDANLRVHETARADPELSGMGTTGVCLLFEIGGRGCVGHVGDSRAYRLRDGKFEQITEDHSVVGALIRMGHITEAEARLHPQRNEILRAIGTNEDVEVQLTELDLMPGDLYLLCSDGLSGMVADHDIAQVLATEQPEAAARILVEMANLEGGTDNITVQIATIPGGASDGTTPSRQDTEEEDTWPRGETQRFRHPAAEERERPAGLWLWGAAALLVVTLGWLLLRSG